MNTNEDMKVVQEEIFGPVVAAMPFSDPEEIIPRANNSDYGLAAGIWTRDIGKAHRMAEQLRARHGVDQLLQHLRCGAAVRRIQTIRLGPRDGPRCSQPLHANESSLRQDRLASSTTKAGGFRPPSFSFLHSRMSYRSISKNLFGVIDFRQLHFDHFIHPWFERCDRRMWPPPEFPDGRGQSTHTVAPAAAGRARTMRPVRRASCGP